MQVFQDRVAEVTATAGTDPFALGGNITGFQAFGNVCQVGDTFDYAAFAIDANGNPTGEWETGTGTFAAGNTIARAAQQSSNGNNLVAFAAGNKLILMTVNSATIRGFGSGGGGGGGSYTLDRTVQLNATKEYDLAGLDFSTYNYDLELEVSSDPNQANEEYLKVCFGDKANPPNFFTAMSHFAQGYGAHGQNSGQGYAQWGYIGNSGTTYLVATARMRGTDDGLSVMMHYAQAGWEMGGTIDHAPPAPSAIGSLRITFDNRTWTGKLRVYRIAK